MFSLSFSGTKILPLGVPISPELNSINFGYVLHPNHLHVQNRGHRLVEVMGLCLLGLQLPLNVANAYLGSFLRCRIPFARLFTDPGLSRGFYERYHNTHPEVVPS